MAGAKCLEAHGTWEVLITRLVNPLVDAISSLYMGYPNSK